MLKNNKGITLIALVITIIVLLILAGVSIAMLTGENGILNQADRAGDETNRAEVLERVNMELNGQLANAMAGTAFDSKTKIDSNLGLSTSVTTINDYSVVTNVNYAEDHDGEYNVDADVTITVTAGTSGDTGTFTEGKVDYDTETNTWKVTPVKYSAPEGE